MSRRIRPFDLAAGVGALQLGEFVTFKRLFLQSLFPIHTKKRTGKKPRKKEPPAAEKTQPAARGAKSHVGARGALKNHVSSRCFHGSYALWGTHGRNGAARHPSPICLSPPLRHRLPQPATPGCAANGLKGDISSNNCPGAHPSDRFGASDRPTVYAD